MWEDLKKWQLFWQTHKVLMEFSLEGNNLQRHTNLEARIKENLGLWEDRRSPSWVNGCYHGTISFPLMVVSSGSWHGLLHPELLGDITGTLAEHIIIIQKWVTWNWNFHTVVNSSSVQNKSLYLFDIPELLLFSIGAPLKDVWTARWTRSNVTLQK